MRQMLLLKRKDYLKNNEMEIKQRKNKKVQKKFRVTYVGNGKKVTETFWATSRHNLIETWKENYANYYILKITLKR